MLCQIRKRTEPGNISYSLSLFLGLSLRNTSKAVSGFVKKESYCHQRLDSKIQTRDVSISKERNMFVAEYFYVKSCKKIWGTSCFN